MRIGMGDDERPARSELAYLIHSLHPEYELVEADGAEAILSILAEEELAGCFVDINLNDMNGTTLVSMMKRICPELPVVFATAYPNYAVRAFELGAADYILKPFEMDRVQAALERMLRNHPNIQEVCEEPDRTEVSGGEKLEKLMVQGVDSYRIIDVEDIIYIETESRVCHLYTAKEVYTANANAYIAKLNALDQKYQSTVDAAPVKTLLFGDRFPFRYMVDDYSISYYAAFVGCSAETEASFETIAFLANKVSELGLNHVMTLEGSDGKIAQTIISTAGSNADILSMDSMQSCTMKDVKAGVTYLSIMEKNLEVLTQALK